MGAMSLILLLWILDFVAVLYQRGIQDAYRDAIIMNKQMADLQQATISNRLHFLTFLQIGDSREADLVNTGIKDVDQMINNMEKAMPENPERQVLERIRSIEKDWAETLVSPLINRRQEVDKGKATVAELQIYLLTNVSEQKTDDEPMNRLATLISDRANAADRSAKLVRITLYVIIVIGMVLTLVFGWRIALNRELRT